MRKIETDIQKSLIKWVHEKDEIGELLRPHLQEVFYVKNEGNKTLGEATQDKRMGLMRGVPDLCFVLPDQRTVFLELKTKKGKLSQAQKDLHARWRAYGHEIYVAYGYLEAIQVLKGLNK